MPPLSVLIKPASSKCNMRCKYCFYRDIANNRGDAFKGMLKDDILEKLVSSAMEYAQGGCAFAFQGGEPTLAGLDFYRRVVKYENKYARRNLFVSNAIQTNGYAVDDEWAKFFAENNFLVGLSLDGPKALHDENRIDIRGKGTFDRVMKAAKLFDKYNVEYNILCVITKKNCRAIKETYSFFKSNGFDWLQFIPFIEPFSSKNKKEEFSLSGDDYGEFLTELFDLWFEDLKNKKYVSVRKFDNWFAMLLGEWPEECGMMGRCAVQFTIEGDGGVYPCDFYALDQWRLGAVGKDGFSQMYKGEKARRFIETSMNVPEECRKCEFYSICRNDCRRYREITPDGLPGRSLFCRSYKLFFNGRRKEIKEALNIIRRARRNERQLT